MEINIEEIINDFGYELKDYIKVRNAYKCFTSGGIKNLKEDERSSEKIELEYLMKKHLYDNGFDKLDLNLLNKENEKPYVVKFNKQYVFMHKLLHFIIL